MEIRALQPGDEAAVVAAGHLFDEAPEAAATARFLNEAGHHLLVAYEEGQPAGFISGVEMTHPDKGTEMFIYELGVDEAFRRRGIGTALVAALRRTALDRGCYGMWVLVDADNVAGLATYANVDGAEREEPLLLTWELDGRSA